MIHEDNGPVFPVVIFPENIRKIIDATHEESCFPVNYIAAALFFAASVAVGNYRTLEANSFKAKAHLFMALLGSPGSGKTHPINFAIAPFLELDKESIKDPEFAEQIRLESARTQDGEDIGLFVKNIENVQGDERDIIIFSIGYAKNENGKFIQNFGWLNQAGGENRLNVAISRAKKKVHVVTSFEPHQMNVENVKNPGPAILQKYLEYAAAVSSGNKNLAKDILLSFSTRPGESRQESETDETYLNDVAESLREEGFEFERNVGIGGYSIDFAIKKNGRYVIGLECDSGLYRRSTNARTRDYHRQKYLESRGWKLLRVWSPSWWKNKADVVQMIADAYDTAE